MKNITVKLTLSILLITGACKETIAPKLPVFSETTVSDVGTSAARVSASITDSGNGEITEHGFVFSEDSLPRLEENSIKRGSINRTTPVPIAFSSELSGLKANTTYFASPYAVVNAHTLFGKTARFRTSNIRQPGITTVGSSNVSHNAAILTGRITQAGTHPVTEYGIAWSTSANPTTAVNTKISVKGNVAQFPFNFTANAQNLQPNTEYHFRAYVIMNGATTYGANMTFKTGAVIQPGIATGNADNITVNSARLAGSVTSGGTHPITERGVVWGTSANPTTASSKASLSGNVTGFPNNYTINATGLSLNTTYTYRAYVISNGVITYGENKTFKTSDMVQPGVRTDESKPANNDAYLAGTLLSKGSHSISEYGICWGTSANPVTSGSKEAITGDVTAFPKPFNVTARNLNAGSTYHYRAYVIMNGVTTYGENKTFTTGVEQPHLVTRAASSISTVSATVNASVNSPGSFPVTEVGIVWGTTTSPTTANNKQSKNAAGLSYPHNYSFNLTGLTQNTTYYFRAYALVNGEAVYGPVLSFKTLTFRAITVSTSSTRAVVQNQGYQVHGTVVSGTYRIVRYGFYYNNIPGSSFDMLQSKEISIRPGTPSSGTVNYNLIIPFYPCGNTVKYRAYAVDEGGNWVYGNVIQFNTSGCVN